MSTFNQTPWALRLLLALSGAITVIMGAGAAHGFSRFLGEAQLSWIETGVFYQIIHLVAALVVIDKRRTTALLWILGGWLFSGSLYCLAFFGSKVFGPITPIGGFILIIAWLCLALPIKRSANE
ncbi:DUF423 domain-containing protein [Agarivorans aestuarii]|uniref:DUF423 domain-containing protein n=1 Tax=Agarivorans aestuarii TaxID=1563703 RepID=UPI001C827424|nr:DUF423 domain-containing protein [Agarivorans aestuarii]